MTHDDVVMLVSHEVMEGVEKRGKVVITKILTERVKPSGTLPSIL